MDDPSKTAPRVPEEVAGIQVNFCKNPMCLNYGRPADSNPQPRGPGAKERGRDAYTISGGKSGSNRVVFLKCHHCGEYPTIKSNSAIQEEILRLSSYLSPKSEPSCPNAECRNHGIGISHKHNYYSFGKTKVGSQRYRCKLCDKLFSVKATSIVRHRKSHKNLLVFQLLMNKTPFKRICEVAGISMPTLYDKLDFVHRQCLSFVGDRERWLTDLTFPRLYISVDRQDYVVNWSDGTDKRNIVMSALGSADNKTSYVFGMHLNFDSTLDPAEIVADAFRREDYKLQYPFRRYARLWLPDEYQEALFNGTTYTLPLAGFLIDEISGRYDEVLRRDDVEVFEAPNEATRLPEHGLQVHAEYTLYGHFFFLKQMFRNAGKVRFFLDQESGIRAACLSAFVDEVLEKRCDAFYVRINKELTINEKRKRLAECKSELERLRDSYPYDGVDLELELIKERMKTLVPIGKWQDKWLYHPLPSMSEPEKAVCWLTDLKDRAYDENHLAHLYKMATLHGIDRFFMQVRRRLSLLERPISSASSAGRKWHGYSAYKPENVIKLLDIFRVFYNYVEVGKDRQTPAMRLGLAKGKVQIEDILYFMG